MIPSTGSPVPRVGAAHARLRAATADLHAEVDALFADGLDSACGYRRYVLGMHRFAADYESATGTAPRQSAWLSEDLDRLSLAPLAAQDLPPRLADAATRLGWRYVMAGSSLGARGLLRDAHRLGHADGRGATFLARHAASDDWAGLRARLQAFDASDASRMACAESGARAAFARVHACLQRSFDHLSSTAEPEPCR